MVNRLDDLTLAAQLCAVRALISVPVTWFETDSGELSGRVRVDCVRHACRSVSGSPEGAILGCIHDDRHTGKWMWVPICGSRSIQTAVGVVPLGSAASRPDWTLDHTDLLRTHPLSHRVTMHPTLTEWNRLKAEAEVPSPVDVGAEWSLRSRQPPVDTALTSLVSERTGVATLDSAQLLLHSSRASREHAVRESALLSQLPPTGRPPPAVPSHAQLSFDFQVGIEHLIARDAEGWTAHQRNGAVHLRDQLGAVQPSGFLAPLFHTALRAVTGEHAPLPPVPGASVPLRRSVWATRMLPDGLLGRLAGAATGAVLDPPQGLHLDWWTGLQLDSGAVVQCGPCWNAWCLAFQQCHQAPAAGQQ
eukprot:429987-Rhodomonas_salina.2